MTNTDGNLYALEKHLDEREEQDERLDLQALLETYEIENDELSRKLAKAVEALRELITCVEDGCYCSEVKIAAAVDNALAVLAELEVMG